VGDPNRAERVARVIEVDQLRRTGNTDRLRQLLEHDVLDAPSRHAAIAALGRLHADDSVPLLLRLFGDPDEPTRVAVAVALRSISSRESVDALIGALTDADQVAWVAADALGGIGDERAADALADVLIEHRHAWVRRSAAHALAKIGGDASVRALERAAARQRNPLRRRALRKLAKQGMRPSR
jgi:HEAT repeat protein